MRYITRELERKFLKLNDFFKVILVTGARQVGKTTMLKHLSSSDRTYVTMDNAMARELAQSDPVLFFQTYKPPILIDEVQKAPELFEQIKVICDESGEKGSYMADRFTAVQDDGTSTRDSCRKNWNTGAVQFVCKRKSRSCV